MMGISQIPDQIKRAPAGALRAVFSGIGRILLAADRPGPPPSHAQPETGTARTLPPKKTARPQRPVQSHPAAESRWRSLDQTGNVRVLTADEMYSDSPPELSDGAAAAPARTAGSVASAATSTVPSPALPLADYDNLSLASIRARLRTLSTDELRILADYERKNAERTDVLGMLERRIEKVENSG
jgi:hypothetical protein